MTDAPTGRNEASPNVATADVVPESRLVERLWRTAQGIAASAVAVVGLGAALHAPGVAVAAYVTAAIVGGGAALASLLLRRRAARWSDAVRAAADASGIRIGARPHVAASELTEAVVTPASVPIGPWLSRLFSGAMGNPLRVELRRRGFFAWPIRFTARTIEEARAIVAALGLGAGKRAITRKVMSPVIQPKVTFPAIFGGLALLFLGAFLSQAVHPALGALGGAFPLAFLGVYTLGFVKTKVTIGADGVSVRWLGRPRTVALNDIASVEIVPGHQFRPAVVRIVRKDGTPFDIQIGLRGSNIFEPFALHEECARIAERIRETMALGERAQPVEFRAWAEHRSAVPIAEWIATLRGALDAYRNEGSMPFSATDLWTLLDNVRASPAERVAAAVAVSSKPDDRTRARLRAVAAATAVPRLRVALEAAVDGDDERLARVLEELRAEELAQPRDEADALDAAARAVRVRVDIAPGASEPGTEPPIDVDEPSLAGASVTREAARQGPS